MRSKYLILAGMLLAAQGIMSVPAAAQGVEFDLRNGDVRVVRPDDYDRGYDRREYRRYDDRYDDRYERRSDRRGRGGCSPRQALAAATNFLNEPRIRRTYRDYYLIDGYGKRGGGRDRPDSVEIYNAPGCDRR